MNAREMIEAVLTRIGGDATSFPRRNIAMRINSVVKEFARYFPDEFRAEATGTIASGASTIPLPSDLREIVSLKIGDYKWFPINVQEKNKTYATDKVYWVIGGEINLRYSMGESADYTLLYYKMPADITGTTDSIEYPVQVHEFVVTIVASRLAPKFVDKIELEMAYNGLRNYSGVQPTMKWLRPRSQRNGYTDN